MRTTHYLLALCTLFCTAFCTTVLAQNKPTSLENVQADKTLLQLDAPANREDEGEEPWLKSPYLKVDADEATVGDITVAFSLWRKEHPEEVRLDRRHKDDEIAKFQRKLYRWQKENRMTEKPTNAHQRMDAFVEYDLKNPQAPVAEFSNRDGNWRLLGPINEPTDVLFSEPALSSNKSMANTGLGRINCIEFSVWDTLNVWVGTSTGGVWKTYNGGKNWINISMSLPIMEVSDIAIDQSNSNIIYLVTGDRDGEGGWYGNGIGSRLYKTTDGGANWYPINANFGSGTFIENLWVHPKRPWEIVAVKTNGIYKSVNGGGTWTQTLTTNYASPFAAPNNNRFKSAAYGELNSPERIYSLYRKRNSATAFAYQVQRSDDFGATWRLMDSITTPINNPSFGANNQKIAIAPSDPNCLYLYSSAVDANFHQDRFGSISRTLDGGRTWQSRGQYPSVPNTQAWLLGDSTDFGSQGTYDLVLSVDPKNRDKIFLSGVDMWGSLDGGMTFNKTTFWVNTLGESAHGDHHWGEYQPISGSYFLATDGGLFKTNNLTPGNTAQIATCGNGRNDIFELVSNIFLPDCYKFPTKWDFVGNGISNNDFYAISVSKSDPSIVMGGAQDNGILMRRNGNWYAVVGGWDGFTTVIHPTNPNTFYATVQFGQTWRTDDGGNTYRFVSGAMEQIDGGNWLTPMKMHDANPNIVIQGRVNNVWRTINGGTTWQAISDFPRSDNYSQTSALAMAASNSNIILAGRFIVNNVTFAGENALYKTSNGGTTWTNLWNAAFPDGSVTDIAIHPTQPNKIWVSFGVGYDANPDQAKKMFYSEDGGLTWTNITAGLPDVPIWAVAVQGDSPVGAVYAGTGIGVFYKDNTMSKFAEFQVGMPRGVLVTDLKIHEGVGKIYAGTYGRGIWSANLADRQYEYVPQASMRVNRSLLLTISPNPARNAIKIEWDSNNVEGQSMDISDVFGRVVYTQKAFNGKTTFDMSNQASGIYTVQLKTGKEVVTKKFVLAKE